MSWGWVMTTPKSVTASTSRRKSRTSRTFQGKTQALADALVESIQGLRDYWPLTVRQVYYQMVAGLVVENNVGQYKRVSDILNTLRVNGTVPWSAIEDRTRRTIDKRGHEDHISWLQSQFEFFADYKIYGRCLVQDQDIYVEVTTEKDALSSIMEDAIWCYCTRLNVIRGQNSASLQHKIAENFKRAVERGQKPVLLHFGDLDPSGVAIPKAMKRTFLDDHGVDVDVRRVALTPEQVKQYHLPSDPDAAKKTDSNYKSFVYEYGEGQHAVELDALHPQDLRDLLRSTLKSTYDMESFNAEAERELQEREIIKSVRRETEDFLVERFPHIFGGAR